MPRWRAFPLSIADAQWERTPRVSTDNSGAGPIRTLRTGQKLGEPFRYDRKENGAPEPSVG
jgi:hypothetical protein